MDSRVHADSLGVNVSRKRLKMFLLTNCGAPFFNKKSKTACILKYQNENHNLSDFQKMRQWVSLARGDFREVERCDGRLDDATAVSYRRQHIPELFNPRWRGWDPITCTVLIFSKRKFANLSLRKCITSAKGHNPSAYMSELQVNAFWVRLTKIGK